jgi:hypothetical protein
MGLVREIEVVVRLDEEPGDYDRGGDGREDDE